MDDVKWTFDHKITKEPLCKALHAENRSLKAQTVDEITINQG